MNLLKNVSIAQILGYFAAGTTKRTSTIIDMANWEGVLFIAGLGTILDTGTIDVYAEQHTLNQTSGMARVAGASVYTVNATSAAYTQSCIALDIFRPQERYLQCNITPAVANAVVLGITAIQYTGRKLVTTLPVSVLKSTQLVSPAEGT
jgi:hypothetical protein